MKKKILISASLTIANMALGFIVAAVLAQMLGASGYGVYSLVVVFFAVASVFSQLGVPMLAMRETASALSFADWLKMKSLWRWAGKQVLGMSAVTCLLSIAFVLLMDFDKSPDQTILYLLGSFFVPLASLGALRTSILRGLGHVILGQLPEALLRNAFLLTVLGSIWFFEFPSSPTRMIGANLAATVLAFSFGAWFLFRKTPPQLRLNCEVPKADQTWFRAAVFLGLSAGMIQINSHADVLILGLLRPAEEVGVYRVIFQLSTLVTFGLTAVNLVVAPRFASAYSHGNFDKLRVLVSLSAWISFLVAIPIALIFFFFAPQVLLKAFGPDFEIGFMPLMVLVIAQVINASFGPVSVLMNMTRNETSTTKALTLAAVLNVIMNFLLIPSFGMMGAAISTAVSLTVWNALLFISARRALGVISHAFGYRRNDFSQNE